mmetsp:Transcript_103858/g.303167  ORF Transcript_103858/g.303167 Transcript_103858/m.303167 type:complete len:332 (-) Transcript_103858:153-1148(-)
MLKGKDTQMTSSMVALGPPACFSNQVLFREELKPSTMTTVPRPRLSAWKFKANCPRLRDLIGIWRKTASSSNFCSSSPTTAMILIAKSGEYFSSIGVCVKSTTCCITMPRCRATLASMMPLPSPIPKTRSIPLGCALWSCRAVHRILVQIAAQSSSVGNTEKDFLSVSPTVRAWGHTPRLVISCTTDITLWKELRPIKLKASLPGLRPSTEEASSQDRGLWCSTPLLRTPSLSSTKACTSASRLMPKPARTQAFSAASVPAATTSSVEMTSPALSSLHPGAAAARCSSAVHPRANLAGCSLLCRRFGAQAALLQLERQKPRWSAGSLLSPR